MSRVSKEAQGDYITSCSCWNLAAIGRGRGKGVEVDLAHLPRPMGYGVGFNRRDVGNSEGETLYGGN